MRLSAGQHCKKQLNLPVSQQILLNLFEVNMLEKHQKIKWLQIRHRALTSPI